MRRYIRATVPGATYFFTLTLQDRQADWLVREVRQLRACFATVRAGHPFHIDAIVVLPDHLHAILTLPPDDNDYAMRWMLIKGAFTRHLASMGLLHRHAARPRGGKGERSVWQRRYWEHQIRNDDDFARHVEYIHFNPVKHGHVQRAIEWPHSSLHRYVREGKVPADWGGAAQVQGDFGE